MNHLISKAVLALALCHEYECRCRVKARDRSTTPRKKGQTMVKVNEGSVGRSSTKHNDVTYMYGDPWWACDVGGLLLCSSLLSDCICSVGGLFVMRYLLP